MSDKGEVYLFKYLIRICALITVTLTGYPFLTP